MKKKLLPLGLLFILLLSSHFLQAQFLPPLAPEYKRTWRDAVEIKWQSPSSDQLYPLYDLKEWIPQNFFYNSAKVKELQDCYISDGNYIYSSGYNNAEGQFFKYDMEGNFLEEINISGLPVIYKMTYDGEYFYGTQYNKTGIYKFDLRNKLVVLIMPTQIPLYHICYIPTLNGGKGGFEAGNPSSGYYFNMDGMYLSQGPVYSNYVACTGTAYFDGKIYGFCQAAGSLKTIVEFDVETAQPTGNILDLNDLAGHAGIIKSQMAVDVKFYEHPKGTRRALVTCFYITATTTGGVVSIFEVGKSAEPSGLQGYNIYREGNKQNTVLIDKTSMLFEQSGLSEETNYNYTVKAVYNSQESPASEVLIINLPSTGNLPLSEDFSSGSFSDNYWEILSGNDSPAWTIIKTHDNLGSTLPSLCYTYRYNKDYEQTIISKPLLAPVSGNVKLRYDVACNRKILRNEFLNVEIGINGTWQTMDAPSSANITSWETKELDISSYVRGKEFQLRFRISGNAGYTSYNWYIDNIKIWNPEYVNLEGVVKMIEIPFADATLILEKTDDTRIKYESVSDQNGRVTFSGIEKGVYILTIKKNGEITFVEENFSIQSEDLNRDIVIPGSEPQIDVSPINVVLSEDKKKNVGISITNTGNTDLAWNALVKYNTLGTGNEQGESNIPTTPAWEVENTFELKIMESMVTLYKNNLYVYAGVSYANSTFTLNKYSLDGTFIESLEISTAVASVISLVSDGEKLYQVTSVSSTNPSGLIPIDLENKTAKEGDIIPYDPVKIERILYATYDPVNDGFYIGSEHVFYQIDKKGKVLKTYDGIIYSYTRNIALDTFSEGGPYMWLYCQKGIPEIGGSGDQATIWQFSLVDGSMTNVRKSIMDIPGYVNDMKVIPAGFFATTALIPGYYTLCGAANFTPINAPVSLKTQFFVYKMFPYENWISFADNDGKVESGSSSELSVEFSAMAMEEGNEREATIIINTNSAEGEFEIPVKLTVDNSIEASCFIPQDITASLDERFNVNLKWNLPTEAVDVKGYNIFRNGKQINNDLVTEKKYIDRIPGMGMQKYTVKVIYEFGCESYDSDTAEVFVNNPEIVKPVAGLKTKVINKKHVQLSWNLPVYGEGIFDGFESYDAFVIDAIGDWKLYDGDKAWTYYNTLISYPRQGERMAFMVFNPYACAPASTIEPYEGEQILASFNANVDKMPTNDWIISPELNFDRTFTLSFMAKTYSDTYGYEKVNVGYSLAGNNIEDFIFINGDTPIDISSIWWKYEYEIPAEAKYVAINCTTTNGYILLLDNIYIGHPEYYSDVRGYNIYRNGEKINPSLITKANYSDYNLEDGTYKYEIEAVFANGTSSKAISEDVLIDDSHDATPPRELSAVEEEKALVLSWLPPLWAEQQELRYDDGVRYNSVGGVEGEQLVGIMLSPEDLIFHEGYTITGVKFHISESVKYVVPFLFENGKLIREGDEMQVEVGEYTEFLFDVPVNINVNNRYIIGYSFETNGTDYYPASHDIGPGITGKGDLISSDGNNWYSTYLLWGNEFNFNWNIAMIVELRGEVGRGAAPVANRFKGKKDSVSPFRAALQQNRSTSNAQKPLSTDKLLGYNIYRNDRKLNDEPVVTLSYSDTGERDAVIDYYVTAMYETSGEKSSNHILIYPDNILENKNNTGVIIYPNPVKNILNIKGEYDELSLVTLDGKILLKKISEKSSTSQIDMQHFSSGVYILEIRKQSVVDYLKIIINR